MYLYEKLYKLKIHYMHTAGIITKSNYSSWTTSRLVLHSASGSDRWMGVDLLDYQEEKRDGCFFKEHVGH